MKLNELIKYTDYDIPCIEFYDEYGDLEYAINLEEFEFDDIDVAYGYLFEPYGIIKLQKYGRQGKINGSGLQPPEGKL